jgi:hypothetical protein
MDDKLITPGQGGGGASEPTRKVVNGWHAMQEGKRESRQQRMLREQTEKTERVKQGIPEKEEGFRPGEEEGSGEFNMRRMKEHAAKLAKKNATKLSFTGTGEMITLKLVTLYEEKGDKVRVLGVEEAGFGKYKLTFFID